MKILLTGANGFIGSNIFKNLLSQNDIYKLSRTKSNYNCNLETDVPIFDQSFDLIIHAAGKAHSIPKSKFAINEFFNINIKGTSNLLAGLSRVKYPKKFIFISSVSVYGLTSGININEDTALLAEDPYGISKIKAEEIVKNWCVEHNIICTILRLPLVAGINAPGNLGSMIRGISKGYYFNIAGGYAKKSMVLVEDVAKFIERAAEVGGIYNLTDGCNPSFSDLSSYIAIQLRKGNPKNMPLWIAKIMAKLGDVLGDRAPLNTKKLDKIISNLTFDDYKAREAFGWNPTPVLHGFKIIQANE